MRALENTEPLPAGFEHFGHERQALQLTAPVQRLEDLLATANYNPFSGLQVQSMASLLAVHDRIRLPTTSRNPQPRSTAGFSIALEQRQTLRHRKVRRAALSIFFAPALAN
jgi:hypothetical protein